MAEEKYVAMTMEEILAKPPRVDYAKLDATTEEDIRRQMIEDGEDPDAPLPPARLVVPVRCVREKLNMTQEAFAEAINIPVATIRNWEQGRTRMDPAVQSLMVILYRESEAALRALRPPQDAEQAAD